MVRKEMAHMDSLQAIRPVPATASPASGDPRSYDDRNVVESELRKCAVCRRSFYFTSKTAERCGSCR